MRRTVGPQAKNRWILPVRHDKSNKMPAPLLPPTHHTPAHQLLTDHVALITGASRGIGRATAERLGAVGVKIVLAARSERALRETAATIRNAGGDAVAVPTDVGQAAQLEALVRTALDQYGRIDILVNNAGYGPPRTPVVKSRLSDWSELVQVNLLAAMALTKHVLPPMIERRHGAIVMLGSRAGLAGRAGEAAYAASKFGLRGFTQALFAEVRQYGIKVSYLCPGYVDTGLIPRNKRVDREKLLRVSDVAEAIYHIVTCSPRGCPAEVVLEPQLDPFR